MSRRSAWTGPAWAAPIYAERHRMPSEPHSATRERWMFGVLCAALAEGLIDVETFRGTISLGSRG